MTREEVKFLVLRVIGAFPHLAEKEAQNKLMVLMWERYLGDLSADVVSKAIDKVVMSSNYPPTISQIREAAVEFLPNEDLLPNVAEAWEEVLSAAKKNNGIVWSHRLVGEAISKLGGLKVIQLTEAIGVERGHFFKIYDQLLEELKGQRVNQVVENLALGFAEEFANFANKESKYKQVGGSVE